jgi:hypothetical protein
MKSESIRIVSTAANVLLPTLPDPVPLAEATLFAFDDSAFPFRAFAEVHLNGGRGSIVIPAGPPGSHDEHMHYYGTTLKIGDTFHMWYLGNSGEKREWGNREGKVFTMSYAISRDGRNWVKPDLGLVEFNGSKHNNIVDFPAMDELLSGGVILHEPDDPDPARRFKMIFEGVSSDPELRRRVGSPIYWGAAFSSDGLSWTLSPHNPMGSCLEMSGITKHRGIYYVNGQQPSWPHGMNKVRCLCTFASSDFEHWSPVSALGLNRASSDLTGPSNSEDVNHEKEVHLGAAMWNRGNVILGIYGIWNGHASRDRRLVGMDLGLAISHDSLHFQEPIPGFVFITARESEGNVIGFTPAIVQGQGMINHGDRTLYWYSAWRSVEGAGVFLVSWPRDRFGCLSAFRPFNNGPGCLDNGANPPHRVITCPIQIVNDEANVYVNVDGLGEHTHLRINLVDEGFRPLNGCAGADTAIINENGLRVSVKWKKTPALTKNLGRVRLDIEFAGIRPEDARLFAVYVGDTLVK